MIKAAASKHNRTRAPRVILLGGHFYWRNWRDSGAIGAIGGLMPSVHIILLAIAVWHLRAIAADMRAMREELCAIELQVADIVEELDD